MIGHMSRPQHSVDERIQFIQESTNCKIETISQDEKMVSLFISSGATTPSEITRQTINLVKLIYRLFETAQTVRCTFPHNTNESLRLGLDLPELYSFTVSMNAADKFIFGKKSIKEFWGDIKFFKKKYINIFNSEIGEFDMPLVI